MSPVTFKIFSFERNKLTKLYRGSSLFVTNASFPTYRIEPNLIQIESFY